MDAGTGTPAPFELRRARPAAEFLHTSHAISPEAVLATYEKVTGNPPPESWLLCVPGESFELGEGLSAVAALRTESALERATPLGRCSRFLIHGFALEEPQQGSVVTFVRGP